jgi:glutamate/aspartate transport system ATP-binding protein
MADQPLNGAAIIEIERISKWYGHHQVLIDCSTHVARGEIVVVCGPSGSGKSTLIKCVNGLERIDAGHITVDGVSVADKRTDLAKLRARIGMVFQSFELYPHMTVIQNVILAPVKALRLPREVAVARATTLLERVGLAAFADRYPASLSGGQQSA